MSYICNSWSVLTLEEESFHLKGLPCKRWTCPECVHLRAADLKRLAAAGRPSTFITLTVDPKRHDSPTQAAKALVHAWRMIRQRLDREGIASSIQFLAVFENHKSGWPHLHIIARMPYVEKAYLSKLSEHFGIGYICDIKKCWSKQGAAKYIGKYLSKGTAKFEGCKRYWRSQDWDHWGEYRSSKEASMKPGHLFRTTADEVAEMFAKGENYVTASDDGGYIIQLSAQGWIPYHPVDEGLFIDSTGPPWVH